MKQTQNKANKIPPKYMPSTINILFGLFLGAMFLISLRVFARALYHPVELGIFVALWLVIIYISWRLMIEFKKQMKLLK